MNGKDIHCKFVILVMKKYTQNEHVIVHFKYFCTSRYSKTVWLADNHNEI